MTRNSKHLEPKQLYRRLQELFHTLDPERPIERLLDRFVDDLFEVLAPELKLLALLLYVEKRDGFELTKRAGTLAHIPAEVLDRNVGFVETLAESRFLTIYPICAERGDVRSRRESAQPDSAAAILVGDQPNRLVLMFVLDDDWDEEDVEFSLNTVRVALASRLTKERMRVTFDEASSIQSSLLVREPPPLRGFDIAMRSQPAEEVGGDFYDFVSFGPDILGVSIGDASGHGLSAALLVRDVVTGLRMGLEKDLKVSYVFEKLNRVIHRSQLSSRFVSVFYGELETNGNCIFINAGHEPPLLFLHDRVEELRTGGTIIGPLAETKFKRGFAHVDRGSTLVALTDGILERRDATGAFFDRDRVVELVRANEHKSAADLVSLLFEAAHGFGGGAPWEDDATALVVKRDP